eukprot:1923370-Rhodomonas_salina.1
MHRTAHEDIAVCTLGYGVAMICAVLTQRILLPGLMQQRLREGGEGPSQVGAEIRLHGHLFDSGLINKVAA